MKRLVIIITLLLNCSLFANDFCKDIKNEQVEFKNLNGSLFSFTNFKITEFENNFSIKQQIDINDKIIDLKVFNDKIYVLHEDKVSIYTKEFILLNQISIKMSIFSKHDLPTSFELHENKIYIGHGERGLVVINIDDESQEIYSYPLPHASTQRSKITGIAIHGQFLIMLFDNITYDFNTDKRAFEGVVISSFDNLKSGHAISIRQDREAHHEGNLYISGNKLYSQHLHILFELDIKKLLNGKYFYPQRRLFNFEDQYIYGRATVINKNVIGCFRQYEPETDTFKLSFNTFKI